MGYFPKVSITLTKDIIISLTTEPRKWELCTGVKGHGHHPVAVQNGDIVLVADSFGWLAQPSTMIFPEPLSEEVIRLVSDRVSQIIGEGL